MGFVAPDDPAALAQRMVQSARHPALAKRLGESGLDCVRPFTWDTFVGRQDDTIETTVEQRREHRA